MSKASIIWVDWTCPYCRAEMSDPAKTTATTCSNGHTAYLGRVRANSAGYARRAFKTAAELREVAARYGHAVEHDRRYAGTLAQALRAHGLPVPHSPERPDRADGQGLSL